MKKDNQVLMFLKHLCHLQPWGRMARLSHRIFTKIQWDSTRMEKLFLRKNKPTKIQMELTELQNKEC